MRRKDRYDTADLDEKQFEPGSRRRVLKNLLGITSKREMDLMKGVHRCACSKCWQVSMIAIIDSLPLIFAACIDSGWGGFILGRESIAR